jgi:hypothetical protein
MIFRQTNKKVFIDLHGVLVNFHGPAFAVHGVPSPDLLANYPPDCGYDIVKACNVTRTYRGLKPITLETFWNRLSTTFWKTLPFNPWALEFLGQVIQWAGVSNICIASAAVGNDAAIAGTKTWITSHLPEFRDSYFLGPDKTPLAHSDAILIDDCNHNCGDFARAGGTAILVSRPWNRGGYTVENPLVKALEELRQLCG